MAAFRQRESAVIVGKLRQPVMYGSNSRMCCTGAVISRIDGTAGGSAIEVQLLLEVQAVVINQVGAFLTDVTGRETHVPHANVVSIAEGAWPSTGRAPRTPGAVTT